MKINEIFTSIEGEGIRTGAIATFIRIAGCNLRCAWCDTDYALNRDAGVEMSVDDVISKLQESKTDKVTVTGGEPLSGAEGGQLIRKLLCHKYEVNLETNGSFSAKELIEYAEGTDGKLIVTMDWKLPSSLMERFMYLKYVNELRPCDVLKFVVQDETDLTRVYEVVSNIQAGTRPYIYLSPVWGKMSVERLVEAVKQWDTPHDIRVQLQLHKLIWGAERRGV